jgi:hypothetical protein
VTTAAGTAPVLPATVSAVMSDGTTQSVAVTWASVAASQYAQAGNFTVTGTIANSTVTATANVTVTAPTTSVSLSAVTAAGVNGASLAGSGAQSSPYVTGGANIISLSTTLQDASGNPLVGYVVTFTNTVETTGPVFVTSTGGAASSTTSVQAVTNASGVATAYIASSNGSGYAQVTATAPVAGSNGQPVTSTPVYVEFGTGMVVTASPNAQISYANASNVVPVTVTLLPTATLTSVANQELTITTTNSAQLVTSTGTPIANNGTPNNWNLTTGSNGQVSFYIADSKAEQTKVTASVTNTASITNNTYVTFAASGIPANLTTVTPSSSLLNPNVSTNTGTIVTDGGTQAFSATVVDSAGNSMTNTPLYIGAVKSGGGTDSYSSLVSGSTTTTIATGTSFGGITTPTPVGTTDANGNISFTVKYSNPTETSTQTIAYGLYYKNTSGTYVAIGSPNETWAQGDTATMFVAWTPATSTTSFGVNNNQAIVTGTGTTTTISSVIQSASGSPNTNFWVEPFNAFGTETPIKPSTGSSSTTFTITANGGYLYSIGGYSLYSATNPVTSATVVITQTSGGAYSATVNGNNASSYTAAGPIQAVVYGTQAGTATYTVSGAGAQNSVVTVNYTAAPGSQTVNALTPNQLSSVNAMGSSVTYTVTATDASGNVVPGATIQLTDSSAATDGDTSYVTAINGTAPQFGASNAAVGIGTTGINATTNAQGQATFTISNGTLPSGYVYLANQKALATSTAPTSYEAGGFTYTFTEPVSLKNTTVTQTWATTVASVSYNTTAPAKVVVTFANPIAAVAKNAISASLAPGAGGTADSASNAGAVTAGVQSVVLTAGANDTGTQAITLGSQSWLTGNLMFTVNPSSTTFNSLADPSGNYNQTPGITVGSNETHMVEFQVLDSQGNPAIMPVQIADSNHSSVLSVPTGWSGANTNTYTVVVYPNAQGIAAVNVKAVNSTFGGAGATLLTATATAVNANGGLFPALGGSTVDPATYFGVANSVDELTLTDPYGNTQTYCLAQLTPLVGAANVLSTSTNSANSTVTLNLGGLTASDYYAYSIALAGEGAKSASGTMNVGFQVGSGVTSGQLVINTQTGSATFTATGSTAPAVATVTGSPFTFSAGDVFVVDSGSSATNQTDANAALATNTTTPNTSVAGYFRADN